MDFINILVENWVEVLLGGLFKDGILVLINFVFIVV